MGKFAEMGWPSDQVIRRKGKGKVAGEDMRNWEYAGTGLGICRLFNWIYNLGGVREEMI